MNLGLVPLTHPTPLAMFLTRAKIMTTRGSCATLLSENPHIHSLALMLFSCRINANELFRGTKLFFTTAAALFGPGAGIGVMLKR